MSDVRKTICDGCAEETTESSPYMVNGGRPEWWHVDFKHKFKTKTYDACSETCVEKVLRKIIADREGGK